MLGITKNRKSKIKRVLFICTGNLYRSRFAEAVFNHYAEQRGIEWRAFSRGLETGTSKGRLSMHTEQGLRERGIKLRHTAPNRMQLKKQDLLAVHQIVAMNDHEHRGLIAERFPQWADSITYWDVPDVAISDPREVLPLIERNVIGLIDWLTAPSNPFVRDMNGIESGIPLDLGVKQWRYE
jgi:protein-tyrosine phosphatase